MAEKKCPHCEKDLKLISQSEKITEKGTTFQEKFRCPVSGCGYTFTLTTEE